MKEYSYKDVKLLRQVYKSSLEQLYEGATAERAERMLNILTVASATIDVPGFAEELNASGEQLLTASLEIFRVKSGPCRQFVGDRLTNAIDLLLFQFTKRLKSYTRKVKEMKLEVDLLDFYRQALPNEDLFQLYITYFKIVLTKLLPHISSQSNVEPTWAALISSLVGNLKRTDNEAVVSKCVAVATSICTQNSIFCKEFVKNGVLLFLLNFVEKCEQRSLVIRCLELIALLTGEKQLGQLLVQQNPQEVFVQLLARFPGSSELTSRIKTVMDNIIKFSEPEPIHAVLEQAKKNSKEFAQNRSNQDELNQSLQYLKLYSLSNGFGKYLAKSETHRWITPLLAINEAEPLHGTALEIIGSMLNNKEAFKNCEEIFNSVSKPLLQSLKYPKSSAYLQQYLKLLATALRKDIIGKDFTKKHGILEMLEKQLKEDHQPAYNKVVKELVTLVELKEGRIKYLPLDVNRKNKDLKELEAVNTYLQTILTMGLYDQVRRQQLDTLSQFLNIQQSDYPNDNEQEVQALAQAVFGKLLRLLSDMFINIKSIEGLASDKLLNNLIEATPASPDLRQSLDLLEIILVANPDLKFNKESCHNVLLNIHRANPLSDHVVASCGEIMFHLDSQRYVKEALKNFNKEQANVVYLEKLALNMCTVPDNVSEEQIKAIEAVMNAIAQQPLLELPEELAQNLFIVLIRAATASEQYRERIRKNAQLVGKVEACFEKAYLKPYVLELFTALSRSRDNAVHRSEKSGVDRSHLRPIEEHLNRLMKKVLDDNNYSVPQLRFLDRLASYDSKPISEKIKVKNAQTVCLAGPLFAHALEENKSESKKAAPIIEELNKQLSLRNRNLLSILKFFNALKEDDHYANLQKLLELSKELCSMKLEDYSLYPVRYTLLQLCLDCLAQNLNKTKEIGDMSGMLVMLEKTLKMFEEPADPSEVCNKKFIVGGDDVREHVVEAIYNCMDAIAGVDTVRVRPNDPAMKYVESTCNPYIVQKAAHMLQKVVQDEGCSESRRKLKDHVAKKFPVVKAMIEFEQPVDHEKVPEKAEYPVSESNTPAAKVESPSKQANTGSTSNKMEQQRPSRPTKTVIESSIVANRGMKESVVAPPAPAGVDMSKMSVEVATKKVEQLVALKEVVPPPDYFISRVVDALREDKSQKADQLLAKLYMKYIKLQDKLCQQDAEALNRIIIRIQHTRTTTECIVEILESAVQVVQVTEKIKLLGERALMYAIKLFPDQPAYAAKIIEYNLVSQRQFNIIEQHKIPEQALALLKRSLHDPDIDKYVSMLVGTSAKSKSIQQYFVRNEMHVYILEALRNNRKDPKIVANCFYALAGLTFCLEEMTNLVTTPETTKLIMDLVKENQKSTTVVEAGCCLVSNLCYHNEEAKKIYFQCNVVDSVLELFRLQLDAKDYKGTVFKQMLRVLGNCSLLVDNAKKMVSKDFVPLSIQLIELVNYNQDMEVLKYVIEVFSNLSSHTDTDFKMYLATMFKQGSLDMLITLLETQLLNAQIIAACIDSIDGLCQDKEVERYAVSKRLISFLLDILKSHEWNEKIVVKAVRVISNLTLDKDFIVKILEANVPSVLANLLANRKLEKSKLSLYVQSSIIQRMKIITRVYTAKVKTDLVMRSGYIDCVLESLKKETEMYEEHVEILMFYAKDMSEFMSKKTFQIVVPVLEKNITDSAVCSKIIVLLKLVDRETDVETVIAPLSRIYMYLTSLPDRELSSIDKLRTQELLNLLIGYCSRCPNLKALLRERGFVDALQLWRKKVIDEEDFLNESIMVCTVVILNEYIPKQITGVSKQESQEFLMKGLHCKMFRRDSTFKKALVSMTPEYELRGFKFPDGEVKDKYRMHVLNVKDSCFKYEVGTRLWELSVFSHSGGLFEKKADAKHCCTIIGPVTKVGAVMLNLEFETEGMKDKLEEHLYNLIRCLREK